MKIDTKTRLCGIIGYPLEHSMSPAIHNAAAKYYNLNVVFLAFPSKDAKKSVQALKTLNALEWTVTMPLKEKVLPFLDQIDPQAEQLGNVNTIINKKGVLKGYNTDIDGVERSLKNIKLKNTSVVLLGAGGAAKTIAYVLKKHQAKVHVLNRDLDQAKKLVNKFSGQAFDLKKIKQKIEQINPKLIINATPVGMGSLKGKSLVPKECLNSKVIVFDVIYNPAETLLIKQAKDCGVKTINGSTMFLGQGARQFELWSGKPAPWQVMEKAFKKEL